MVLQGLSPHVIELAWQQANRVGEAIAPIEINEVVYFEVTEN